MSREKNEEKLSDKGLCLRESVCSFLTLFWCKFLALFSSPQTVFPLRFFISRSTDCLFILKVTVRIPDVNSVCFENQQATDCWKWDWEIFLSIDNEEHLFCLIALASLSKVKPNGVFRLVSFLISSGNSYMGQKALWVNRGCFTTGCHSKPVCL